MQLNEHSYIKVICPQRRATMFFLKRYIHFKGRLQHIHKKKALRICTEIQEMKFALRPSPALLRPTPRVCAYIDGPSATVVMVSAVNVLRDKTPITVMSRAETLNTKR